MPVDKGGTGSASLNFVQLTGDQVIAGTKTFGSTISGNISGNAGTVTNGVYVSGDQTIGGSKTFSSTIQGNVSGSALTAATATTAGNVTGVVAAANGGTGQSSYVVGDLIFASGTAELSKLAAGESGKVLTSNGDGTAPSWGDVPPSGWGLQGNSGTIPGTDFIGTIEKTALEIKVGSTRVLRLEPGYIEYMNIVSPNVIAGNPDNSVLSTVYGAVIAGGGYEGGNANSIGNHMATISGGSSNVANGEWAVIGGGGGNEASDDLSTVCGGGNNHALGVESTVGGGYSNWAHEQDSTVGGGNYNRAYGVTSTISGGGGNRANSVGSTVSGGSTNIAGGEYSVVGGGGFNTADGGYSLIGGGYSNYANGYYSTIPGGYSNKVSGTKSLAAGTFAEVLENHSGSFVWSDTTSTLLNTFKSTSSNEFSVLASGGVRFVTNSGRTTGARLASGGSSWDTLSDRNSKENIKDIDAEEVLTKLSKIPISTWNYKAQDSSNRHMGPMAQDFYEAFHLGADDKHINTIDLDGVALVAIQGLNKKLENKTSTIDARMNEISRENDLLKNQNKALIARIEKLEKTAVANGETGSGLKPGWLLAGGMVVGFALVFRKKFI